MSDFIRMALILAAAVNPAAFLLAGREALADDRARVRGPLAAVLSFAALALSALLAGDILDFLEVEAETFRVAAGVVLLASGAATLLRPAEPAESPAGLQASVYPLAWPLLVTPAALAGTISLAADEGEGETIGVVAIALAISAALALTLSRQASAAPGPWRAGARLLGALLVVLGAGLIVSGVRDV